MYLRGYMTNGQGEKVPAFTVGTAGGGNYNYGAFDPAGHGYTGTDSYVPQVHVSNSASPTFGYLLVTVYTDNTWIGEFRGFQFNHWNTSDISVTGFSVMDSFDSVSMLK